MFKIKKFTHHIYLVIIGLFLIINISYFGQAQSLNIKVGTDPTFPPFEFTKNSDLIGFDIDLIKAISKELDIKIDFVSLPFDGTIGALKSGQIDAVISSMTITKERLQSVDFSRPYFKAGLAIAVSKNNQTINDFADLKGKKIAVQIGTTGEAKAREIPDATIITFNDAPTAIQELVNGKVDAVINDLPVTMYAITTGGIQGVRIIDQLVTQEYYGIAFPQNSPNLNKFNQAIAQLIKNGTYQEIYQKWFSSKSPELPLIAPALNTGKQTQIPPSFDWENLIKNLIIKGLPWTLGLTIFSFTFGLIGGILIGIIRLYAPKYLSKIAGIYVEFFRGTPLLVQLYVIYFGLPTLFQAFGLNFSLDNYIAAVIALSINLAAYIAEIVRGGIESIDKGQWEACHSLGMNKLQTMQDVILPQAFRQILPPLGNQFISLIKDTSLAAVIGLDELFRQGQLIVANTYAAFSVYSVVAIVYFVLSLLSSWVFKRLEILMTPKIHTTNSEEENIIEENITEEICPEINTKLVSIISCKNLKKNFGNKEIITGITIDFYQGQVTTIIGPSGCGKTTCLRTFNGLETVSDGFLEVMGYDLSSPLKEKSRIELCKKISMVFQGFHLFPHLTIKENLILAPKKVLNLSLSECEIRAWKSLDLVHLKEHANDYPETLSGGQKQRAAIARSLCMNPEVILFDEPTSALDPELAYEVLEVIEDLAKKKRITMIIVTHSMHFAKRVSNRVLFLKKGGTIGKLGTPSEIFDNPEDESLKSFLKRVNFG